LEDLKRETRPATDWKELFRTNLLPMVGGAALLFESKECRKAASDPGVEALETWDFVKSALAGVATARAEKAGEPR
jgi:hypothetical protein